MFAFSSSTLKARCAHFGVCGGCAHQEKPYEEQLRLKGARVSSALGPLGLAVCAVHPSPEPWYYRNKMEFSFSDVYPPVSGGPVLKLGLKARGRWYQVEDLRECFLLSPETPVLLAAVRKWALNEGLEPYIGKRHRGFLRHLVVREGKNTHDRLVLLVTAPGELPRTSFVEAVRAAYPATTVLWGANGKLSDTAFAETVEILDGPGHIREELRFGEEKLSFKISPYSFFQTNTRGAELLYSIVRGWLSRRKPKLLLDLYCGGGGIGISCASVCGGVVGVETNPSAIEDAKANASLNGLEGAQFYGGAVETLLPSLLAMKPDAAVVDPPRSGLNTRVVETLRALGPESLVYVSCNPEALARDLVALSPRYRAARVEVVDLFPHTEHVETAVWLERAV